MSKEDRTFYVWAFMAAPFVVSGAFWVSPWLGVPTLLLCIAFCVGVLMLFAEAAEKKEAAPEVRAPEVRIETHYKFAGTHDERMECIRQAAAKAGSRNA